MVVVTNTPKYPNMDRPTGLWLGEAVHFVEKVEKVEKAGRISHIHK